MRQASLVIWTVAGFLLIFPYGESQDKAAIFNYCATAHRCATSGPKPQCNQYPLPGCPRNFNPVCGTDGNTYANECTLCESNRENHLDVGIAKKSSCQRKRTRM